MDRATDAATARVSVPTAPPTPLALQRAERAFGALAAAALIVMVSITCLDVIGRYLLNRPLTGAFELSEMTMGALVFASLPLVVLRRQHVTVDLLDWALPGRREVRDAAASLVAALCVGAVAWRLWVKAAEMMASGETTAVLKIPMYPLVYAMAALSFMTTVLILAMGWVDLRRATEQA